ncbi:DivIVA domain-containing protein [Actinomadura soli]|uniref:DivIVA domain-containing protein n=1 Tax=Actinomadura soli TaxID=2508997 RepID=UPI0038B3A1D2
MTQIVPEHSVRLKPLSPELDPVVQAWANELRGLFLATGLSINRFALLNPHIDKGTISRYLNGRRVPRERWFLDKLLDAQEEAGRPLTPAVREHLADLQVRALEMAHPHEYKIRKVTDELQLAVASQREAERHARDLEQRLAERIRQVDELTAEQGRLRNAWASERTYLHAVLQRLDREITELTAQLKLARDRGLQAEYRCQRLEEVLDLLDPPDQPDEHIHHAVVKADDPVTFEPAVRTLALAQQTADQAIADSRREADEILMMARREATQILDLARTQAAASAKHTDEQLDAG